jgi:hypothetical protein
MSGTWGACRVLARLRESGLLGAESRRVKEREAWRLLGRGGDIMARTAVIVRSCGCSACRERVVSVHWARGATWLLKQRHAQQDAAEHPTAIDELLRD